MVMMIATLLYLDISNDIVVVDPSGRPIWPLECLLIPATQLSLSFTIFSITDANYAHPVSETA